MLYNTCIRRLLFLFLVVSIIVTLSHNSFAQSGPGGVGNANGSDGEPENIIWYAADSLNLSNNDQVSQWDDISGNENNGAQATSASQPEYLTGQINGLPVVSFDGTDDHILYDGSLIANDDYTFIAVAQRRSNSGRQIITGGSSSSANQNLHFFWYNSGTTLNSHHYGNDFESALINNTESYSGGTDQNEYGIFSTLLNSGAGYREHFHNDSVLDTYNNGTQLSGYNGAAIGRFAPTNEYGNIDVAEVIIYSSPLNHAQLSIVHNYLSEKYDINIVDDLFTAPSGYNNYISGIGRKDGENHDQSSSGGLYFSQNGGLDDGEFLFISNNNALNNESTIQTGSDVLNAGAEAAWNREWYFQQTGSFNTTISFDFGEAFENAEYPQDPENYVLLYRADPANDYTTVSVGEKGIQNGDQLYFDVNNPLNDGYYTLGSTDTTSSPLEGAEAQKWYTLISGDWSDPNIWTLDPSGALPDNPNNEIPDETDKVEILSGNKVQVQPTNDSIRIIEADVYGRLDLTTSVGHNFGKINGSGKILMAADNFPRGDATNFVTKGEGEGTVEFYGSSFSLDTNRTYFDVIVNMNTSTNKLTLLDDYSINGDFTIKNGVFQINDATDNQKLNLNVKENVWVKSAGKITVGTGNPFAADGYAIGSTMPEDDGKEYHSIFHQFIIGGDFTNDGDVKLTNLNAPDYDDFATNGAVTVRFTNANNATVTLNDTTDFYNLLIDKGTDKTYVTDIYADNARYFQLFGPNSCGRITTGSYSDSNPLIRKALWVKNGTLKLTGNIHIPTLSEGRDEGGNGDYAVGENGRLWIAGPGVTVYSTANSLDQINYFTSSDAYQANGIETGSSHQAMSVYGEFKISDGFFGTRNSAGFIFWPASNAQVKIDGGECHVAQMRSAGGGGGVASYSQTGGTVYAFGNEGPNGGEYTGSYPLFGLQDPAGVFQMSGGDIILQDYDGDADPEFYIPSLKSNYKVTGGTVTFDLANGSRAQLHSNANLWNLNLTNRSGSGSMIVDLDTSLNVSNDLTISDYTFLDHDGFDVTIGHDFYISENAAQQSGGANNYGYLYDPALPNTTTFNGTGNGTFFIGHPDSDSDNDWELYLNRMVLDKPAGDQLIMDSDSEKEAANVSADWLARIVRIDSINVKSGVLNQGNHSVRLVGNVVNSDQIGVYDASTHDDALIMFAWNSYDIKTTSDAIFGNIKVNTGDNIVSFSSNVYIKRIWYRHGRLNPGRYNLKVDNIDYAMYGETQFDWDQNGTIEGDEQAVNSPMDMFVFNGEASSGGLSLRIDGNGTYKFPVGNGTDATEYQFNDSKYTPVEIDVSSFNDEGYITVIPVDHAQLSMGEDTSNALQHYWSIDYEGFSTVPDVQMDFYYHDYTDGVDVDGNENNFVPARLISLDHWEVDGGGNINTADDIIQFSNGTLTRGDYTAGQQSHFNQDVRVLYARKDGEWHDYTTWSTTRDGSDPLNNANQLPEPGDICVIGNSTTNYSVAVSSTHPDYEPIEIARLCILRYGSGESSLVTVGQNGADCDFGVVTNYDPDAADPSSTSNHASKFIVSGPDLPKGDFGQFMKAPNTIFTFSRAFPGTNAAIDDDGGGTLGTAYYGSYTIGPDYTEYPVLQFEYSGYNNGYIELPDTNVIINHDVRFFKGDHTVMLNDGNDGDVTVKKDIEFNSGNNWNIMFQSIGSERTLTVEGDINFNNNSAVFTAENAASSLVHKIRLQGDVINVNNNSDFQLYHNSSNTSANLEFFGSGNSLLPNMPALPSFNKIVMNKVDNPTDTAFIQSDFSLGADPSGNMGDKPVQLQYGILTLDNNTINADLSTGGEEFYIPSTSALQVEQGQVNISGGSGMLLDGTLQINGGTVDMSGGDNYIEYSASGNATLKVTTGDLTVGSQIRRPLTTNEGILNYSQTGGTVVVGETAAPEDNRGVLEILNSGSKFNHTGGELFITRAQQNPSIAALYLDPEVSAVTNASDIHIGSSVTPNSQVIDVYSDMDIPNLTVNNASGNTPKAKISTVPLTITNHLNIEVNTEFDANGLDLFIKGDLTSNGSFIPNENTTYFNGADDQNIFGQPVFYTLYKTNADTLILNDTIGVSNYLRVEQGVLKDNGNNINVYGDIYFNGRHLWGETGDGILLKGSAQQEIKGNGVYGKLSLKNPEGAIIPETGNNIYIDDELQMDEGVLNIGGNLIELDSNAVIVEKSAFSANNMIQTNISFTDAGIKKYFSPISSTTNFVYPIGSKGKYTPVSMEITNSNQFGYLRVRAADERHPSIVEDTESPDCEIADSSNVLQYHWLLEANGLTGFNADANMVAEGEDVLVDNTCGYTVNDYITARLLENDVLWNKFPNTSFQQSTNTLNFSFSGANDEGITGDYTAGIDGATFNGAIPDSVPVYHSAQNGNWKNNTTWEENITGGPKGAIVIIDDTVTVTKNFLVSYKTILQYPGMLNVETTFGHRLGLVSGQGTLSSSRGDLPAGDYDDFFSATGGTLEYAGTNDLDILSGIASLNNIRFVNTGIRRFPNQDITLYGNFEILGDNNTLNVINEYDRTFNIQGNITFNKGSFDAGTGTSSEINLNGNSLQTITGNFEDPNAFNYLTLQNSSGLEIQDSIEINETFTLNDGMVYLPDTGLVSLNSTADDALSGANSSKYIQGPLRKKIQNGESYTFEVGDTSRYGKLELSNTDPTTTEYWEVQYYDNNPDNYGYDTSSSKVIDPLKEVSGNEFWRVKGPATATADVKIRWDDESLLPAKVDNRDSLHIAKWRGDRWTDEGNIVTDNGVNDGTVKTDAPVSVDGDSIFTLASEQNLPLATATFTTGDTSVCQGGVIALRVKVTGDPNISFNINKGTSYFDTYTVSSEGDTTIIISNNATVSDAETYAVDSVGDANGQGVVYGDSVTVSIEPPPTPVINGDTSACQYSTHIYSVTDNSDHYYNWSVSANGNIVSGAGTNQIQVEWNGEGTGTVELIEGISSFAGCETLVDTNVNVYETPEPNVTAFPSEICYPDTVSLDAGDSPAGIYDFNYSWTPDSVNNQTTKATYFTPTKNLNVASETINFKVVIENAVNTGCTATDSIDATIYRRPETGNQYYVPNDFDL